MHQVKEDTPHHEAETGKGHHCGGQEIFVPALHFQFSSLLENAAVQQLAETPAMFGGLH